MKKLLSLFFIFLLSFSIYAEECTASDDSDRTDAEEQTATSEGQENPRPSGATDI